MGLDISHIKAVLEKPNTTDPALLKGITEENFKGFNVEFIHFSKYIQSVGCSNVLQTIIIVEEERYLQETIGWFKGDYFKDYIILFKRNEEAFHKDLEQLENKNHLKSLYKHINTGVMGGKWKLLEYYEIVKKTGFYTQEVGYQRKGMNGNFGVRFMQGDAYRFALWEDFEYAYDCVDSFETSDKNFKDNFLDKFELGASYMSLSY